MVNAYSPKTQGNAGFKIVTSNTFTTAPRLVEDDVSESEYVQERLEAQSYLLGQLRK